MGTGNGASESLVIVGQGCVANGINSVAIGGGTSALTSYSYAEGYQNITSSSCSHIEGSGCTTTSSIVSHNEGANNLLTESNFSHIEGTNNNVSFNSDVSHTEGT